GAALVAPEFQIANESSVVGWLNFVQRAVAGNVGDITPDYGTLLAIADDARALIDEINLVLAATQLSAATTAALVTALQTMPGGIQYALAPELAPLLPLFTSNRLAVILNVGTLVQPTTKAQYAAKSVPLPPKLFSHNDQQSVWQSSAPEGATSGWGGRMGDLFEAGNGNATFTCVNVSSNAVFLSGHTAVQYQVSPSGPVALNGVKSPLFGSANCSTTLHSLVTAPSPHLFE